MRAPRLFTAIAVASITLLAGCAPGDASADAEHPGEIDELIPITVGVIPSIDVSSIYAGAAAGIFEEEGLDVTLELAQGGAAIVPAVVSGEYQFGFSNITSLLLASDSGVPLRAVAAGPFVIGSDLDSAALVVAGSSSIQSPADLEGRTVAVNALHNFTETVTRNAVELDGGDASAVNFVEVAIPEIPAALETGQIDAGYIGDPGLSRLRAQGARVISYPAAETDPNLMISAYFTSRDFATSDPEVVEAFARAMARSADFAQENPDATRDALADYLDFEDEIRSTVVLPRFSSEFTDHSFQVQADLALKFGLVTEPSDISELMP